MASASDLDPQLASRLVDRFGARVVDAAVLPPARAADLRESCEISINDDGSLLRLTCTITGSTYERSWDGSDDAAIAIVDEVAEDTATLLTQTPHYAWIRSGR